MKILEGKTIRDSIHLSLKEKVKEFFDKSKICPTLVIIQVGNNPASNTYIKMKKEFGESIGAIVIHKKFDESISESHLLSEIAMINKDRSVNGVIVQLPIPNHINRFEVTESIDPLKDADSLHSKNRARGFMPATTRGIMTLLSHYGISTEGKKVLMIGRSELVGIPTALAFLKRNATVTIAHSKTENIPALCEQADIIVTAIGKPGFLKKNMVRKGQIVIDVGITNVEGELKGDVDFDEVSKIVSAITPVPGGIGPLTVASLFENLMDLCEVKLNQLSSKA